MNIEQEIGSLMAHIHREMGDVPVYLVNVPKGMKAPSLYFPPPITSDSKFTSASFQVDYTMHVKVFHLDQQQAQANAERIAMSLRKLRFTYALLDEQGADTGRRKKLKSVNVRLLSQPDDNIHVAQLSVEWESRYAYDVEIAEKMQNIFTNYNGDGDPLAFSELEGQQWDVVTSNPATDTWGEVDEFHTIYKK